MGPSLRLLLVDDDDVDRLAVKRLLRQTRFDAVVEERIDRASALAAFGTGSFDCVLLDYNLPGADGIEILHEIRAKGDSVPVIALTGQGDEEVAVALMKAGASDYLNKNSLTAERLERSLRYALAIHRADEERRLLLEREQRARQEAQAANRAKDEFLATLSHELRTPLNAMLGWAHMLRANVLPPETQRRALETLERNVRTQAQLVDDLLDVSRIVAGKLHIKGDEVDLTTVVMVAADTVRPASAAKGLSFRVAADPDRQVIVMGDVDRLRQILWNLLTNAVKFTPRGGHVEIELRTTDTSASVVVTDTGQGIRQDFLRHVFERFRQADGSAARRHGGLGLGLAIVRHLTEAHGGSVSAESAGEGLGATFTVQLPIREVRTRPSTNQTPEPRGTALAGLRVLLVDDEPDTRDVLRALLEVQGANVTAASSAGEALELLRRHPTDVLLADIGMPDQDGYALIEAVRALPSTEAVVPAVAVTAYVSSRDRARALKAGYGWHVAKPVDPDQLIAVVSAAARSHPSSQTS
jgi:Signal transduction histidine kinase